MPPNRELRHQGGLRDPTGRRVRDAIRRRARGGSASTHRGEGARMCTVQEGGAMIPVPWGPRQRGAHPVSHRRAWEEGGEAERVDRPELPKGAPRRRTTLLEDRTREVRGATMTTSRERRRREVQQKVLLLPGNPRALQAEQASPIPWVSGPVRKQELPARARRRHWLPKATRSRPTCPAASNGVSSASSVLSLSTRTVGKQTEMQCARSCRGDQASARQLTLARSNTDATRRRYGRLLRSPGRGVPLHGWHQQTRHPGSAVLHRAATSWVSSD